MFLSPYVNPTLTLSMLIARETRRSENQPLNGVTSFPVAF
jgi:hypothetical protein